MKPVHRTMLRLSASPLLLSAVLVAGCATATPPPMLAIAAAPSTTATNGETARADAVVECDLVCERAQMLRHPSESPDYNAAAVANADEVLGTIHGDLLACYKKRVAVNPKAHGFITVDILIDPDGKVEDVETTGGAVLGEGTMICLVDRIKRANFAPVHGGGTQHIRVPFSLRRVTPDETM